jgi:hypothetical protein
LKGQRFTTDTPNDLEELKKEIISDFNNQYKEIELIIESINITEEELRQLIIMDFKKLDIYIREIKNQLIGIESPIYTDLGESINIVQLSREK